MSEKFLPISGIAARLFDRYTQFRWHPIFTPERIKANVTLYGNDSSDMPSWFVDNNARIIAHVQQDYGDSGVSWTTTNWEIDSDPNGPIFIIEANHNRRMDYVNYYGLNEKITDNDYLLIGFRSRGTEDPEYPGELSFPQVMIRYDYYGIGKGYKFTGIENPWNHSEKSILTGEEATTQVESQRGSSTIILVSKSPSGIEEKIQLPTVISDELVYQIRDVGSKNDVLHNKTLPYMKWQQQLGASFSYISSPNRD